MTITKAKRYAKIPLNDRPQTIQAAISKLKEAREQLRDAGSKNAADYVAKALKSAEGALRHAERMYFVAHSPAAADSSPSGVG